MYALTHGLGVRAALLLAIGGAWGFTAAGGCAKDGKPLFELGPAKGDEDVWSIRCLKMSGENAPSVIASYAKALRAVQGLKPGLVQVLDEPEGSTLYYGRYARRYDAITGKQTFTPDPRNDLNLIRQLALSTSDEWPFRLAQLDALPMPDVGDAAWDLRNAQGHWSLNVAVFYNTGEMRARRQAAVEYCKLLREQGEEAYYHHGSVSSAVCVGAFPLEAIEQVTRPDPITRVPTTVSKIVDPKMLELQKKHPYNLENGHIMKEVIRDPGTNQVVERIPLPSFPVAIPRDEGEETGGGAWR